MSASFIIRYAGQGVSIVGGQPVLVDDRAADRFISEQDAWYAAFKAGLNPDRVSVLDLYAENQKPIKP